PGGLDGRAAMFRSVLHGKQMLVVLDNARTPEQVRPLLPGSSTCLVLVSSRDRLDDLVACEGARLYALDVLGQTDAGDLLSRMAGDHRVEPPTADRIAALCDRLPLALRIAAARLATHPHHTAADLADGSPTSSAGSPSSASHTGASGPASPSATVRCPPGRPCW